MQNGTLIEGEIATIAFGGAGILRHEGLVTFVPYTAPGDTIRAQVCTSKKSFAQGRIVELLSQSPLRISAPCAAYEKCGGCQLQHLVYPSQMDAKVQFVQDALTRIAKLRNVRIEAVPALKKWAYRRHIRLGLTAHKDGGFHVNYVGSADNEAVPIDSCPIFLEDQSDFFQRLNAVLRQIQNGPFDLAMLQIVKGADGFILDFQFEPSMPSNALEILKRAFSSHSDWAGAVLRDSSSKHTIGNHQSYFTIDGMQFTYTSESFVQVHVEQSEKLYLDIRSVLVSLETKHFLDLYCGLGVMSVLAAALGIQVVGVESNPIGIDLARHNAKENVIPSAQFMCGKVEDILEKLLKKVRPDTVLINPPRAGMKAAAIQALLKAPVRHLIYVSCMPPTLARDIQILVTGGYQVQTVRVYDMFPQTTHVETLVHLTLAG